ncbi:MAG TPA: sigma 54-interacting transcriptional regulator [Steroidobacteraceae bacterium]|jgi:transcriptional regulator of acetoin/glycerol metabolism
MANATGIRVTGADPPAGSGETPAGAQPQSSTRAPNDELIAIAAHEMDRLHERIQEAGCALLLTDASGAILHEKTNAILQGTFRVHRVGMPLARTLTQEREIVAAALRASQHALTLEDLAGEDPQMLRNVRSAYRIADSGVSVLIQGPTGSGKEAFAHAMHLVSRRAERPFVAVNCAAIPETLIESELFGYKSGAFTGARKEGMRGKILQSAGGTLFLDEIGDMPLTLQTRLLRVLEEQEIVPLGSENAIKVDLHVIAASHRNLREMIASNTFREDLYYRLNGITLELPALRDRADKERVIHHALAAETGNGRPAAIEMDALQRLLAYPWPGNVRELRNVIRTALAICEGGVVRGIDLPREIREVDAVNSGELSAVASLLQATRAAVGEGGSSPVNPLRAAERAALVRVIAECHGNMTRVASQLGMSRNTLYRRMKRHAIALAHGSR